METYGLHWDGQIAWLCQDESQNYVGLRGACPFEIRGKGCCHNIPRSQTPNQEAEVKLSELMTDPLVRCMLPLPRPVGRNLFFVEDPFDELGPLLTQLARLGSPTQSSIRPMWTIKASEIEKEMACSNVLPWVLVQADQREQKLLDTIGKLGPYKPRTVVVVGKPEMVVRPPFQRIRTQIKELPQLPWEALGARLLQRYAYKEPILDGTA